MPAEIRADAETMFDELDNENHGFITDKDNIYALFLGMGVTFESEASFKRGECTGWSPDARLVFPVSTQTTNRPTGGTGKFCEISTKTGTQSNIARYFRKHLDQPREKKGCPGEDFYLAHMIRVYAAETYV